MTQLIEGAALPDVSVSCERCGQAINSETLETRRRRGNDSLQCSDCNRPQSHLITYGEFKCKPWSGDVDLDTMQPLKDGKPYLPGERICGHADCVNRDHIRTDWVVPERTAEELLAEQCSLFYRTGKRLTYKQLVSKLEQERREIAWESSAK